MKQILVNIINLPKRTDRRVEIVKQFSNRDEFRLKILTPVFDEKPTKSLWKTIVKVVNDEKDSDFIIIGEDDHCFTEHYSKLLLFEKISNAIEANADILSGGVSWCTSTISVTNNLLWVEKFSGLQFIVIFKKFYEKILSANFEEKDCADYKISELTNMKFVIFPFVSVQMDYGYSDISSLNNYPGRVQKLFEDCSLLIESLLNVRKLYKDLTYTSIEEVDYNSICIPTYIICQSKDEKQLEPIKFEFEGKKEFDITFVDRITTANFQESFWNSIRKIILLAIKNDDDVIVISDSAHKFSNTYSRDGFLKNVITASHLGATYLSGGSTHFEHAIPITTSLFWVARISDIKFIVLYKQIFQTILNEPFDNETLADKLLSEIIQKKLLLFPYIYTPQKDDVGQHLSLYDGKYRTKKELFEETQKRLANIIFISKTVSDQVFH